MRAARLQPNLILLLEAVTVGGLHQIDVLQQVGHPYGRMELSGLIGRLCALAVVPRDVQQSAVLGRCCVVLIWERGRERFIGTHTTGFGQTFVHAKLKGLDTHTQNLTNAYIIPELCTLNRTEAFLHTHLPVIGTYGAAGKKRVV